MIIDRFQVWARTAPASGRADGVRVLAKAFLYSDLGTMRREAMRLLTEFLDDPSPLVRRALAEMLASAPSAPHHIVLTLADDQTEIAAIVLAQSPVLTDAELIDCAASGDEAVQVAIASRAALSEDVAAALAEIAMPAAVLALAGNRAAALPAFSIRRLVDRHGDDPAMREALLARDDLPTSVRVDLVAATTRALAIFVTGRNWMSEDRMKRVATEARDKAAVTISGVRCSSQHELVKHLRRKGQLTVGLAFRAILSGRLELFKVALAELSGVDLARVDGLTQHYDGAGFAAVYRKAGLPGDLLPAFRAALRAMQEAGTIGGASLSLVAVEQVLTACATINHGELDKLLVMLRRFEAEAAREEARIAAEPSYKLAEAAKHAEPLLLRDFDDLDGRQPARLDLRRPAKRRQPVSYEIDMAAIETLLCAA